MTEVLAHNNGPVNNSREFNPISGKERLPIIDILRGVAILGILLLNMLPYSFPTAFEGIYTEFFSSFGDQAAYWGGQFLFRHKFVFMLAVLLGLGMAVQVTRAAAKGKAFSWFYFRRILALAFIALLHDVGIWSGIILIIYTGSMFLLLFFQRRQQKTLIVWAVIFAVMTLAIGAVRFALRPSPPPKPAQTQTAQKAPAETNTAETETAKITPAEPQKKETTQTTPAAADTTHTPSVTPPAEKLKADKAKEERLKKAMARAEQQIEIYQKGTYWDMMVERIKFVPRSLMVTATVGWEILALFLIGIWAWQRGLLQDIEANLKFFKRTFWVSMTLGFGLNIFLVILRFVLFKPPPTLIDVILFRSINFLAPFFITVFYMTGVVLLWRKERWKKILTPLAAVGRTALSNYFFQSIVCSFIFYSFGFALFGKVGPLAGLLVVAGIWAIQIPLSVWWIRHFRFGPVEWLWRSLTYWKRQPFLINTK